MRLLLLVCVLLGLLGLASAQMSSFDEQGQVVEPISVPLSSRVVSRDIPLTSVPKVPIADAKLRLPTTSTPIPPARLLRIKSLLGKGGRALLLLEGGVAGEKELHDLQSVRLALRAEMDAMPVAIQEKYHASLVKVDTMLGKAITTLRMQIGALPEDELEISQMLSDSDDVSEELFHLVSAAVESESATNPSFDAAQRGGWGRGGWGRGFGGWGWGRGFGGWGWGGFGRPWGFGGWGYPGFGWGWF